MSPRLLVLVLACWAGAGLAARAQEDYLTDGEVSSIRDTQEPDKRMILWMDFAQRRVDAVKQALSSPKPYAGRTIQKTLVEYVHIMESLGDTIQDARERRVPLSKGLRDVETRGNLILNYLKSLGEKTAPGWKDYEYTLDEAKDMTRDELAEVGKGNYPEVKERKPPTDLPARAAPPASSTRPPARSPSSPASGAKSGGQEEGPPRKSRPSSK